MMSFANSNPKSLLLPHLRVITGPMPTELAAAHTCDPMRESFNNEHEHAAAFDSCANLEDKVATALCEDKWEPGHGGADVYMGITRDYDLLVRVLTSSLRQQPAFLATEYHAS